MVVRQIMCLEFLQFEINLQHLLRLEVKHYKKSTKKSSKPHQASSYKKEYKKIPLSHAEFTEFYGAEY